MGEKESKVFFEELYRNEYETIKKYVRRMVTDSNGIEDIVQETFYEAYRKRKELMVHPNVPGWLRLTAKNKILKWEDKQRKYSLDFDFLLERVTEMTDHKVDGYKVAEYYSVLERVLSKEEIEMLKGYYEYGYTANEMAKRYDITETNFKVRILRMKHRIKDSLLVPFIFGATDLILRAILFMGDK